MKDVKYCSLHFFSEACHDCYKCYHLDEECLFEACSFFGSCLICINRLHCPNSTLNYEKGGEEK